MADQQVIVIAALFLISLVLLVAVRHNKVDWGVRWFGLIDGLNRFICIHYHRLQPHEISLPEQGACIVACNHVSGLDSLVLIAAARRPLRFMIAREEYERFGLQWLFRGVGCIPVERKGRPEQALREALRTLQSGEVLAIFPHGKMHLDSDPARKLKKGVAWLAQQANVPVIPLRLTGVRGEGHTILSVFMRSRVKIESFDSINCGEENNGDCLEKIAACIEGRMSQE